MRFMNRGIYYDTDDSGGGGTTDTPATPSPTSAEERLAQAFANLANRQGGTDAAGVLLLQENRGYREQIRTLEQQVRDLEGRVPGDDAVVLSGDDATRWQAYQELGAPDEIRQQREEYQTLQRRQLLGEAATAAGFKAPVLERLADGLTVELRDVQQDGQTVRRPFVVPEEGDAVALPDYARQNWADFLPALTAEPGGSQGRSFISQTPAGSGTKPANVAEQVIQKRYASKKKDN